MPLPCGTSRPSDASQNRQKRRYLNQKQRVFIHQNIKNCRDSNKPTPGFRYKNTKEIIDRQKVETSLERNKRNDSRELAKPRSIGSSECGISVVDGGDQEVFLQPQQSPQGGNYIYDTDMLFGGALNPVDPLAKWAEPDYIPESIGIGGISGNPFESEEWAPASSQQHVPPDPQHGEYLSEWLSKKQSIGFEPEYNYNQPLYDSHNGSGPFSSSPATAGSQNYYLLNYPPLYEDNQQLELQIPATSRCPTLVVDKPLQMDAFRTYGASLGLGNPPYNDTYREPLNNTYVTSSPTSIATPSTLDEHAPNRHDPYIMKENNGEAEEMATSATRPGKAEFSMLASIRRYRSFPFPFSTFLQNYTEPAGNNLPSGPELLGTKLTSFVSCIWRDVLQKLESQAPGNNKDLPEIIDFLRTQLTYNSASGSDERNFPEKNSQYLRLNHEKCRQRHSCGDSKQYSSNTTFDMFSEDSTFRKLSRMAPNWEFAKSEREFELRIHDPPNLHYVICQREESFPEGVQIEITMEVPAPPEFRMLPKNGQRSPSESCEALKLRTRFSVPSSRKPATTHDHDPKRNFTCRRSVSSGMISQGSEGRLVSEGKMLMASQKHLDQRSSTGRVSKRSKEPQRKGSNKRRGAKE
ncbi:hypothetical protein AA313_de0203526 [Arthrobotrys entomopaga]|nr:hypothetical protein AA313_de0203526 [Arthrobotrys entomopaga]